MDQEAKQAPRGTYDILPEAAEQWQRLEAALRQVVHLANYREIRTPIFEHTELFKRSVGDTTDIVNKEMYTFEDKSERSLTLRPEGTAGVVRAYLQEGMSRLSPPVKLYYQGPMFRYERPQAGRQRQFHQFGIEAFGSPGPAIDAEVIALANDCLTAAGVKSFWIEINSIGCKNCRPKYRQVLQDFLRPHLPDLCADCKSRFERNPLRLLDCKVPADQARYKDVPSNMDSLCDECKDHFNGLRHLLKELNLETKINERLVRGLDYYGRTVFEFISDDKRLGVQSTICAGGRYDYLVESLGGKPTFAVGWGMGLERVKLLLDDSPAAAPFAFVVSDKVEVALSVATAIRQEGFSCELDFPSQGSAERDFKKQLQQANKLGVAWTIIAMEDERKAQQLTVKDMSSGTQTKIAADKVGEFFKARIADSALYGADDASGGK